MTTTGTKTGIMVCGHGSRDIDATTEFQSVAAGIKARLPEYDIDSGFLEFATPIIRERLEALRDRGNTRIIAVPSMLLAAGHVKNDLPSVINTFAAQNPELEVTYARDLGLDMRIVRAAGDRVQQAIDAADAAGDPVALADTLLVVVGRGASDPDANSDIAKVCRMLWEGMGFGWAQVAYSGVTFPLVEPSLEHAVKLGYKRIIVFPYFLFTGILVRRIYHYADQVAARYPDIEFIKASYLNDHPLVMDAFAERAQQAIDRTEQNNMNCQMCTYREQILGFEANIGLPQESHHHHVEGIGSAKLSDEDFDPTAHVHLGNDHSHDHSHEHTHDHAHDHAHHPYPQADHPLGPRSMLNKSG